MTDQTAADFFGATTIRPPLDPELAPVEEARGAVYPALSDGGRRRSGDVRAGLPQVGWTSAHSREKPLDSGHHRGAAGGGGGVHGVCGGGLAEFGL